MRSSSAALAIRGPARPGAGGPRLSVAAIARELRLEAADLAPQLAPRAELVRLQPGVVELEPAASASRSSSAGSSPASSSSAGRSGSRPPASAAETSVAIATSRGSTPASAAASIASAAIPLDPGASRRRHPRRSCRGRGG